jgi:hypothetical protein
MAIPIAGGETLQIKVYTYQDQQVGINTYHWDVDAGTVVGSPTLEALCDLRDLDHALLWAPIMASTAEYLGTSVQAIYPLPRSAIIRDGSATTAGTAVGDPLPKQICGLLSFLPSVGGVGSRGRIYLPFPAEDNNDASNQPDAGYRTLLTAIADDIALGRTITTGPGDTFNFTPRIFKRSNPLISPGIIGYQVAARWATQQRRGDFGSPNFKPIF